MESTEQPTPMPSVPTPGSDPRYRMYIVAASIVILLIAVVLGIWLWRNNTKPSPVVVDHMPSDVPLVTPIPTEDSHESEVVETTQRLDLALLAGADSAFSGSLEIPTGWQTEVVPELEAINIYDPTASGVSVREKSQVFIRHFQANAFLTLSTVEIIERHQHEIAGRPAVTYIIKKLPQVANFAGQPVWRNEQHRVTDVRLSDRNPSEFLVIGFNPAMSDEETSRIIASFQVAEEHTSSIKNYDCATKVGVC